MTLVNLHFLQSIVLLQVKLARHAVVSVATTTIRTLQDSHLVIVRNRCTVQAVSAARVTSLAIRHHQLMIEPSLGRRQMGGRIIRARCLERVNIDPAAQVALWCANSHLYLSLVHPIDICPHRDNL